jgi:Na+-translocating ferredoxin:NAD+ oxidoreductase RnfD subunit
VKRTGPGILVLAGVIGIAAGFLLDQLLVSGGRPTFTPMATLPILLLALGVIVLILAIPIRRATHGRSAAPVNPFRALRIAILAKASSILGAGLGGFAGGLMLFLLTRPVTPSIGSWGAVIATIICGILLMALGLVAEHLCTIRKDDDDEHPGDAGGGFDARSH